MTSGGVLAIHFSEEIVMCYLLFSVNKTHLKSEKIPADKMYRAPLRTWHYELALLLQSVKHTNKNISKES